MPAITLSDGAAFDVAALPDLEVPTEEQFARARAAAGRGTSLAQLVSEGRR